MTELNEALAVTISRFKEILETESHPIRGMGTVPKDIVGVAARNRSDEILPTSARIAVLVPCFNEAATVTNVVQQFSSVLPKSKIYIYDNNSTDNTAALARGAGAIVRHEPSQGKGNVVRRMFADVEADVYLLVDGDNTYDAEAAPILVTWLLTKQLDFVNGARDAIANEAYRKGHKFGNWLLSGVVRFAFKQQFTDMLSGYKVFSRRFVKSFPATSRGFEIETELAIHAFELRMPCAEIHTAYRERPEGSESKLRTYRDGTRILFLIARLIKDERPLTFFGTLGILLAVMGVLLGVPIVVEYERTGLVPRFPTAILSSGLVTLGTLSSLMGLLLEMVTRTRQEIKRLAYLAIPIFESER